MALIIQDGSLWFKKNEFWMEGTFKVVEKKYDETRIIGFTRTFKTSSIANLLLFLMVFFNDNIEDKWVAYILLFSIYFFSILIGYVFSKTLNSPTKNTIIQLGESQIIRTGKNLLTVRLQFEEIGTIRRDKTGLILIKKGIMNHANLYLNKHAFSSEFGILFIPSSLEKFKEVERFINSKINFL